MRIAHIISGLSAQSGGTTKAVLDMVRWQSILGAACTIVTGSSSDSEIPAESPMEGGATVVEFPAAGPRRLRYLPGLADYLKDHLAGFDLAVLHSSYQFPAWAASYRCRQMGIPYIFTPHGSLDPAVRNAHPYRNRLIDRLYHDRVIGEATAWHFTSDGERRRCERPIWRRSFVEPLGFEVDDARKATDKADFRERYAIPASATLLLFLSRITRKKGIDILLDAFCRVAPRYPKLYLALCGPVDRDMAGLIADVQRRSGAGDRVIPTGFLGGDWKEAAFAGADCFVLPTYSENFGIAVFEALAHGLPVITTTGMDLHAELAKSGRVNIVRPEAGALAAALVDWQTAAWRPTATVEEARAWLRAKFSWRARAGNLLAHYADALKEAERGREP